jgi:hypothetical protein
MAAVLRKLGFKVNLKKNADLETMEAAIEDFGNQLKRGGVGLFYYAGHGVQVNGVNYLIPVGAKISKESDVRFKALDAGRILAEMENANNGMNIVLLDACRDNPFGKSFRSASRGLAIVSNSPSGTFISYSTSPGQVARDGEGRNSPYTRALLDNMGKPGLTINSVFMKVRGKVKKETGQVPWELSSLEGDFFFVPGSAKAITARDESVAAGTSPADELEAENRKLEEEQSRLAEERALLAKQKEIAEKRQKIADEKDRLKTEKDALSLASEEKNEKEKIFKGIWRSSGGWVYKGDGEYIVVVAVADSSDKLFVNKLMFKNIRKDGNLWRADNAYLNPQTGETEKWIDATFELKGKTLIRRNNFNIITLERIE